MPRNFSSAGRLASGSGSQPRGLEVLGLDLGRVRQSRALLKLQRHLEGNIHRPVPLAEAARVAGFERTYFSQYFHTKVGVPYSRWANAVRISRAIDLLLMTGLSCTEIAAAVGYREVRTFQRNFKRLTGATPTEFRHLSVR